jgi:hypothetical protein
VDFPRRAAPPDAADVQWVGETQPIRVEQFDLDSVQLGPPRKLACISCCTTELVRTSSGESVLTTLLRESAAMALDASVFSNQTATADRPAGLLLGVTPITAATGGDDAAMMADLSALAAQVGQASSGLAFVAHARQANVIRIRRGSQWPGDVPVWPTIAIPPGRVIALSPETFVSAFGSEPRIDASRETLIHTDTAPAQIGTPGSPNVVAAPTRSMWQSDTIAVKLTLKCAWALRGGFNQIGNFPSHCG